MWISTDKLDGGRSSTQCKTAVNKVTRENVATHIKQAISGLFPHQIIKWCNPLRVILNAHGLQNERGRSN